MSTDPSKLRDNSKSDWRRAVSAAKCNGGALAEDVVEQTVPPLIDELNAVER